MLYKNFKRHKIKNHSDMFRVICDPSSGSIELYLTEIRSGSQMTVVCLVGVFCEAYLITYLLPYSMEQSPS